MKMEKIMKKFSFLSKKIEKCNATYPNKRKQIAKFKQVESNPNVSDLPEKETTITVGENLHTIRSRYGVPDALRTWEKGLMRYVLKEIEWEKTAE